MKLKLFFGLLFLGVGHTNCSNTNYYGYNRTHKAKPSPSDASQTSEKDGVNLELTLPEGYELTQSVKAASLGSSKSKKLTPNQQSIAQNPVQTSKKRPAPADCNEKSCAPQATDCLPHDCAPFMPVPPAISNDGISFEISCNNYLVKMDDADFVTNGKGLYNIIVGQEWYIAPVIHLYLIRTSSSSDELLPTVVTASYSAPFVCDGAGSITLSGMSSGHYSVSLALINIHGRLTHEGSAKFQLGEAEALRVPLEMQPVSNIGQVELEVTFKNPPKPTPEPICLGCLDADQAQNQFLAAIKTEKSFYLEADGKFTASCVSRTGPQITHIDRITLRSQNNGTVIEVDRTGSGCNDTIESKRYIRSEFFKIYNVSKSTETLFAKDDKGNFSKVYKAVDIAVAKNQDQFLTANSNPRDYYLEVNGKFKASCKNMIGQTIDTYIEKLSIRADTKNNIISVNEFGSGCNDAIKPLKMSRDEFFTNYLATSNANTLLGKDQQEKFTKTFKFLEKAP